MCSFGNVLNNFFFPLITVSRAHIFGSIWKQSLIERGMNRTYVLLLRHVIFLWVEYSSQDQLNMMLVFKKQLRKDYLHWKLYLKFFCSWQEREVKISPHPSFINLLMKAFIYNQSFLFYKFYNGFIVPCLPGRGIVSCEWCLWCSTFGMMSHFSS